MTTTTVLVDCEAGNLHSAQKAFQRMAREIGSGQVIVSSRAEDILKADRIVLPGDGAFPACQAALFTKSDLAHALKEAVCDKGRPFLGICVGMQLLATTGHEYEKTKGLDWIKGEVCPIATGDTKLKVPHMGWNELIIDQSHPVLNGIKTGNHAYFVHSYQFKTASGETRLAHVEYGQNITAIVGADNIIGTQFHPEKSQETGLKLIANFLNWTP